MIQTLWIPGKLPSLNQLIFTDVRSRIKVQKAWVDPIALLAKAAKLSTIKNKVYLSYIHKKAEFRGDPSNWAAGAAKVIEDGLVKAGVLPDDSFKYIDGFQHEFKLEKLKPGVLVYLEDDR